MLECDCCNRQVQDLPYSHIDHDPPHHQTDYCQGCWDWGCDDECYVAKHAPAVARVESDFTDNEMAEVLKSFGLEGTA